MAIRKIDELMRSAGSLTGDEMLEFAHLLIERAKTLQKATSEIDINSLAGSLSLREDPLAIQDRLRREWD